MGETLITYTSPSKHVIIEDDGHIYGSRLAAPATPTEGYDHPIRGRIPEKDREKLEELERNLRGVKIDKPDPEEGQEERSLVDYLKFWDWGSRDYRLGVASSPSSPLTWEGEIPDNIEEEVDQIEKLVDRYSSPIP